MTYVYAAVALLYALLGWFYWCTCRAHDQRMRLIDYAFNQPDWPEAAKQYRSVSFERHLLAVLCGRNPKRLYAARLHGAFD